MHTHDCAWTQIHTHTNAPTHAPLAFFDCMTLRDTNRHAHEHPHNRTRTHAHTRTHQPTSQPTVKHTNTHQHKQQPTTDQQPTNNQHPDIMQEPCNNQQPTSNQPPSIGMFVIKATMCCSRRQEVGFINHETGRLRGFLGNTECMCCTHGSMNSQPRNVCDGQMSLFPGRSARILRFRGTRGTSGLCKTYLEESWDSG